MPNDSSFTVTDQQVLVKEKIHRNTTAEADDHHRDHQDADLREDIRQSATIVNLVMAEAYRIASDYALDQEPEAVLALSNMILAENRAE